MPEREPFDLLKVSDIEDAEAQCEWLVSRLWLNSAVGIIGGEPKSYKTSLGLDIALSVASGTPCLGEFEVPETGPVLVYPAEESLAALKKRLTSIASARGLNLADLPLYTIGAPRLRIDDLRDQERLSATINSLKPKLVLLDPFIRISRADENNANEVSAVLEYLRSLQREFSTSIILVHHTRKPRSDGSKQGGIDLRGSSDLYAWVDSMLFVNKRAKNHIVSVEHRSARAPEEFGIALAESESGTCLTFIPVSPQETSLRERILHVLQLSAGGLDVDSLRKQLGGSNDKIRAELRQMEKEGTVLKNGGGYSSAD